MTTRTVAAKNTVLERTYQASLRDVWELWTTKAGFESWLGRAAREARRPV